MRHLIYVSCLFLLVSAGLSGCDGQQAQNTEAKVEDTAKPTTEAVKEEPMKTIVFFGNSLTAGYGLEPVQSFPSLIQKRIDSLGLRYQVINAGVSGETTAAGNNRIDWLLKRQKMDVFVLELGANDGLRGLPVEESRKNLQAIIDKVKAAYPECKIVLAGMEVPPSMGGSYVAKFRVIFRELATKNNVALIPFLLDKVAGEKHLNLPDGIHPSAEGQKIVAENVWKILQGQLTVNRQQ